MHKELRGGSHGPLTDNRGDVWLKKGLAPMSVVGNVSHGRFRDNRDAPATAACRFVAPVDSDQI